MIYIYTNIFHIAVMKILNMCDLSNKISHIQRKINNWDIEEMVSREEELERFIYISVSSLKFPWRQLKKTRIVLKQEYKS